MNTPNAFARISEAVEKIALIDTHEHIPNESSLSEGPGSFFDFFEHYVSSDLVSAGMAREDLERMRARDNDLNVEARWALMAPYWPYARSASYGRAMRDYMRDLFGVDDIDASTVGALDERVAELRQPGWYRAVLREKAKIDLSLVIRWPAESVAVDQDLFRAVPILDHFANAATRADLEGLESECGCSIQSLDQLCAALAERLSAFQAEGIVGVKIFQAYRRTLLFERVSKAEAARCFDRLWLSQAKDLSFADLKPLEDYVMRFLIGLAADAGLPIQIHTGLQEGNGNYLENSRPTLLSNLFMEFADAQFDVFHAGYPYVGETAAMAKYFPNVYADLCWVHAISPHVAKDTLHHWLDVVPTNKILGFGGDSNYVEGAYGHSRVARRVTAEVLAEKISRGDYTEEDAVWVAARILRENARELFGL
jgi:uncharacterized protein